VTGVYDAARAYALAFSYRDVPTEVDALLAWAQSISERQVGSVLELAAGPADHAREFAARGMAATALDNSLAMTNYARTLADQSRVRLDVVTADMCDFAIDKRFDLAFTMLDSISHILSEEGLDAHFRCVASHLADSGCYVIEASHPDDSLDEQALTQTEWTQTSGDEAVTLSWGQPGDVGDPQSGVRSVTVTVDYRRNGHNPVLIRDLVEQRTWRPEDILASLTRVGGLSARRWFGSFAGVAVDDATAWRLIAILQRK
jgi:hypothetical protein